ncbi:hypothetical protein C8T65DRAFT_185382 [Cerioporus squamosus]|nr:hypothetical protein C8T65DRAFT_185382 [Cerioporus squamosus]
MSLKSAKLSTVLKGTTFENRTLRLAREHLSMSLRRVGGSGDGGIDLQGWWWLPLECLHDAHRDSAQAVSTTPAAARFAIRILAQCKAEAKKAGPRHIREFEGTILRHSAYLTANASAAGFTGDARNAVVGLFASTSPFTKASLLQAYSSPIPLALLHLPELPESHAVLPDQPLEGVAGPESSDSGSEDGLIGTLVFNPALSGASGLLRGRIEPRWERSMDGTSGRPGLWSEGQRLESWIREVSGE